MKFTIGIPAYKSAYLRECIDSILAQTYSDFEIVIVNDASPENIDVIINNYDSPSIIYHKNERNFGAENVVDNWNKCLSYAKGEFFILMGDDDKMLPNYLEEFVSLIQKYPLCNVYHGRTIIVDEKMVPIEISEPRPDFETVYDSILQRMKGYRLFFISDYVFRTEVLRENGGFFKLPLAWASDDITSYIAAEKQGIAHTNRLVFMYRQNSQNISSTGNVSLKMNAVLEEEKWFAEFLEKEPKHYTDRLLWKSIKGEIKKFIQKKKIRTIYSENSNKFFLFFKWFRKRKAYKISNDELIYGLLMSVKDRRKKKYDGGR